MKTKLAIILSTISVALVLLILVTFRRLLQEGGQVLFEYIVLLIVLVGAIYALIQWIRKEVGRPVSELIKSMQEVRNGNLDYIVDSDAPNEVGELCEEYEKLRMKLKEKAKIKEQIDRESRELISNITHDLKTPLTAIKGYSEGIIDGVVTSSQQQDKYIRTIYSKASDMTKLIEELEYYTKIDTNKIPYNFEVVNVGECYEDCTQDIGLDLDAKGIRFDHENEVGADVCIIADIEQLKRVVHNLVNNAVKYTDKEEKIIRISFKDDTDFIKIEVEDNGKGIAAKDMPYIFDRFYRTDASRNSETGGSGIGLSICKKIVEDHGGHIWANSTEGEGSTFSLVLRKHEVSVNE